jgi:hypothetical protein
MLPVEEATGTRYSFRLQAKVPKALVSYRDHPNWRVNNCGPSYWDLDDPSVLLAARTTSKEFAVLIQEVFFGENTFELHDDTATLTSLSGERQDCRPHCPCAEPSCPHNARFVAHRWLELMMKHKCLALIRRLNVDINLKENSQAKWHVRRTFQVLVCMPHLRRLVITVDMSCFGKFGGEINKDLHFPFENAATEWHEWPSLPMLAWAESALGSRSTTEKGKIRDNTALTVFVPQCGDVQE